MLHNTVVRQWNYYKEDGPHTNNHVEGWHSQLKKAVGKPHQNVYELVEVIKREESITTMKVQQLFAGASLHGSAVVLDDLNGHLSVVGRNILRGVLLQETLDRNDLTDVSSGCLPTGPSYTYSSGSVRTKIDYTLMNVVAASLLSSVETRSMHGGPEHV